MKTLTALEKETMLQIPEDDFYENGLDSCLWTDVFLDSLKISSKQGRGVLSSLVKKELISLSEPDRGREGNPTYFTLTEEGKTILSTLLSKEAIMKNQITMLEVVKKTKATKKTPDVILENHEIDLNELVETEKKQQAAANNKKAKTKTPEQPKQTPDTAAPASTAKKVEMYMFTGLMIAEFEIHTETDTTISVNTKRNGILTFNKKDGKQVNPKNKGYANYIKVPQDTKTTNKDKSTKSTKKVINKEGKKTK